MKIVYDVNEFHELLAIPTDPLSATTDFGAYVVSENEHYVFSFVDQKWMRLVDWVLKFGY